MILTVVEYKGVRSTLHTLGCSISWYLFLPISWWSSRLLVLLSSPLLVFPSFHLFLFWYLSWYLFLSISFSLPFYLVVPPSSRLSPSLFLSLSPVLSLSPSVYLPLFVFVFVSFLIHFAQTRNISAALWRRNCVWLLIHSMVVGTCTCMVVDTLHLYSIDWKQLPTMLSYHVMTIQHIHVALAVSVYYQYLETSLSTTQKPYAHNLPQ